MILRSLFLSLLTIANGQFVPAPTDLISKAGYAGFNVRYKEVPSGICETTPGVKSYSGYVDVAPDQHIFFWFFEARNQDPSTAPLTIFLNGGPGDPSTANIFSTNGPCWIDFNGNVQNNKFSWNNASNMLYIDQPTQSGFSYSIPVPAYVDTDSGYIVTLPDAFCPPYAQNMGTCGTYSYANFSLTTSTTPSSAPNVWRTLQGFMGAFPAYSRSGVHLSTESYGGHYGPIFASYFESQNAALPSGAQKIELHSLSIANGWYDPTIQYPAYYNYTVSPGNTFSYQPFTEQQAEKMYNAIWGTGNCLDQLLDCNTRGGDAICSQADNFCYGMETIFDTVTGRDEYDIRELNPDPFPYLFFVDYLNKPEIQAAIGAYTNFSYASTNLGAGTVATAFGTTGDDARKFSIIEDVRKLVKQGVAVLMYAGDADYNCNWLGGEAVAKEINTPGFVNEAGYEALETRDGVTHGVVKQAGNFSFVRVYDSGHDVPFYKPLPSLTMFERLIAGQDIATGEETISGEYRSTGPQVSTHQNDKGTIQHKKTPKKCVYDLRTNEPRCPSGNEEGAENDGKRARWRRRRKVW